MISGRMMTADINPADSLNPNSPLFTLEKAIQTAGISCEWVSMWNESVCLQIDIASGRSSRAVLISEQDAIKCLEMDFTKIRALGEYDAYEVLGEDPCIEVSLSVNSGPTSRMLERIPGWEAAAPANPRLKNQGSVAITGARGEDWLAELGTPSDRFDILSGRGSVTLRLKGRQNKTYGEALAFLESAGNAILFEVDLKYGLSFAFRRMRPAVATRFVRRTSLNAAAPTLPRLQYAAEPLSLYRYARSAVGMPLLEFLAYYQVLEYHFYRYSQRDLLDKLRNELRDPNFRADDERHLSRILRITRQPGRGYGDERGQLKSTVRYCVSEDAISDFFSVNPEVLRHFSAKKQAIAGLGPVDPQRKKGDLADSLCERIYDIRCRVVHSKEDGGGQVDSLLMPFSPEAESLRAENVLMRFLAQKVLIAGAIDLPA
ncbi:hypothetical protein [Streptomyces coelicoflavus]|uniref:Uncharacterized protein n=1 Tax=Streptomyces coelicoflavus TaxID=285562 RepID=A0A6N9UP65_9ACTN|nr:hypothetical protein [Streptomyces coelicoflavus]NEB18040.1 hypothetical protein [Streptomyces coelicoflavus]